MTGPRLGGKALCSRGDAPVANNLAGSEALALIQINYSAAFNFFAATFSGTRFFSSGFRYWPV